MGQIFVNEIYTLVLCIFHVLWHLMTLYHNRRDYHFNLNYISLHFVGEGEGDQPQVDFWCIKLLPLLTKTSSLVCPVAFSVSSRTGKMTKMVFKKMYDMVKNGQKYQVKNSLKYFSHITAHFFTLNLWFTLYPQ